MTEAIESYLSYSAPSQHGQHLLEPSFSWAVEQLKAARVKLESSPSTASVESDSTSSPRLHDFQIGGQSYSMLRTAARHRAVQLALEYTTSYRDLPKLSIDVRSRPIVMGGHQPELFHCGVWFKNFLLSRLGKITGAIPIHFIVDNDLCRGAGITVPSLQSGEASNRFVHFDVASDGIPWESRRLIERSCWESFPRRVLQTIAPQQHAPLIEPYWRHVLAMKSDAPIGVQLSQARHMLERDMGLESFEVPLSRLVSTPEFAEFSLYLIEHLAGLHFIYNAELDRYRKSHRIRNHAQPLPNLTRVDDWMEAPFWCYNNNSERRSLWVQFRPDAIVLSDLNGWESTIQRSGQNGSAVEQWLAILHRGVCLRPKALITTMYVRLMISDLFVHGIGGGKYDQITDRIVYRLFGIEPPPMLVASATMRLDFKELPEDLRVPIEPQIRAAEKLINVLTTNPEQLLQGRQENLSIELQQILSSLAMQKVQLLATMPDKGEKWEWHIAMKKLKQQMADVARPAVDSQKSKLDQLTKILNQQNLLNSREYSFCLFSAEQIMTSLNREIEPT